MQTTSCTILFLGTRISKIATVVRWNSSVYAVLIEAINLAKTRQHEEKLPLGGMLEVRGDVQFKINNKQLDQ